MFHGKKVVVVMPAYNAAATLQKTHEEVLAQGIVDRVIVVDDASADETLAIAEGLPQTTVHRHAQNTGYGGNQKTCYRLALDSGADIVIIRAPSMYPASRTPGGRFAPETWRTKPAHPQLVLTTHRPPKVSVSSGEMPNGS